MYVLYQSVVYIILAIKIHIKT